jgi:hypothetical protein
MIDLMDDRKFTTYVEPRRTDTYFASRATAPHRCWFGGSNRCSCGKHRDPMGVSGILPLATAREHLAVDL